MAPKQRPMCKCPKELQKICKKSILQSEYDPIQDIIIPLQLEAQLKKKAQKVTVPKLKIKKYKPPHFKDTCVPMKPSMHERLKIISHCDPEPYKRVNTQMKKALFKYPYRCAEFESILTDQEMEKFVKDMSSRMKFYNAAPTDIAMNVGAKMIKHTESNKSILNVPSPKLSGDQIPAQRASTKPGEMKPPLPAQSGHALFKPHSGIVINADSEFVPDVVAPPHSSVLPSKPGKKKKSKYCAKGVCLAKNCKKKKCRAYQRQRQLRDARTGKKGGQCKTLASYMRAIGGARDGKPRSRSRKGYVADDDVTCGLDDVERPDHPEIPLGLKKGSFKTHSLTVLRCTKDKRPDVHYGIIAGTFNMYDSKFAARSRGRQGLTMSVMGYCLAFHFHPKQWTGRLVDNLLEAGDQWHNQLADKQHDHSAYLGMCEMLRFGKKEVLLLNGKKMQVLLCEPEIVGYSMSVDPTVYNLCRGLKAVFCCPEHRAVVLLSRVLKVVIWKDNICFYIFDPAGRDGQAYCNFASGTAALINVKDLNAVAEILLSRSILEDQKFILAPVKVLRMIDEKSEEDLESERELTQAEKAMMSYRILTENLAIVNANMHLGDRCFEDAKFRQALTIAVAALTYAKISPPNTWYTKTLDKIIRLGNKLYLDCAQKKVLVDLTLDMIPNIICLGPYTCEIILYRERTKGQLFTTKECILNIRTGLAEFFRKEYNGGILDFNNYKIAVWRQKEMFYMFDPYPRTNDGLRALKTGKGCCFMLLNTDAMADAFIRNWNYLPVTTPFHVHAFKVLKVRKKKAQTQIKCTLSENQLPGKVRRRVLSEAEPGSQAGDGDRQIVDVLPVETLADRTKAQIDEEQMGEIISLVESIQDDYIPPIPQKYKNMPPEPLEPKILNLDSPTVSVTQVVPMWPRPRDKTNDLPEPDPDPEPTPPPTPPPPIPPEGGVEEEEAEEEELDEEALKAKKEEEKRRKAEEEEALRKLEELPPPMPPPPPSPQPETEVPLATMQGMPGMPGMEGMMDERGGEMAMMEEGGDLAMMEPVQVERYILLTEDAKKRFKLRQIRKKMTAPLAEAAVELTAAEELEKPSNFNDCPDTSQIIRGQRAIPHAETINVLPFAAIMAIVTSYKYSIDTWTPHIVDFVIDTSKKLYENKKEKFQLAPMHVIPKIGIGHQAYNATIDVFGDGPTWQLEDILTNKFLSKYDRGMLTTVNYSCAFFRRNGLYYLFDGSTCNAMGLRDIHDAKGRACFMRFRNPRDLTGRILYNKDGTKDDQQFVLSRVVVRRLLVEPRCKLPEDYDYDTMRPKGAKSKPTIVPPPKPEKVQEDAKMLQDGYKEINGVFRIEGTTSLNRGATSKKSASNVNIQDVKDTASNAKIQPQGKATGRGKATGDVKACHFVSLVAMLMATMHPLRTWNQVMVDTCIEKGLEIYDKAACLNPCEKRVIKNIILDGKFLNVNIKKIIVINENTEKSLDQYVKAVLNRLRYVIIKFPECSMVICQSNGFYHLFDPYPPPTAQPVKNESQPRLSKSDIKKSAENIQKSKVLEEQVKANKEPQINQVAGWTLYTNIDLLLDRIYCTVNSPSVDDPEFYTFELTSVKNAPRQAALNYKLSPLFKPDENPNAPYLKQKKPRPLVDEKMYWLSVESIPWSRINTTNDVGLERGTPKTKWYYWDIEFPGDLYSLWGSIHPRDARFERSHRDKQYLACCVIAIVMTQTSNFSAWTGSYLDGIVIAGDKFHEKVLNKIGNAKNHEIKLEDLQGDGEMYPFSFNVNVEVVIFGFVYNLKPDRFNLSKALSFFFETHTVGILTSPGKNLAFGKIGPSYFMYDCQSYGPPIFCGQNGSYMLKCESLNRLIYCITLTLNIHAHNQPFHLYSVTVKLRS